MFPWNSRQRKTSSHDEAILELWKAGLNRRQIAERLDLQESEKHVNRVITRARRDKDKRAISHGRKPDSRLEFFAIPDEVIAERERRQLAAHRDLTSAICGDPLPGFSALDRRVA